jgi:uncharacterized protein YbjT (DUF2867 family)
LPARGEKVRVIVRSEDRGAIWRERGAEFAVGSLGDRKFLANALSGAAGFFTLLPPDNTAKDFYDAQRRMADAMPAR